ncbi:MAG: anthranilate synthase component I family protein [Aquificae bacterium]|nr:anthranilate synthase component I family protein [Aquificota bacterium]
MELLLRGSWLGLRGFLRARVSGFKTLDDPSLLTPRKKPYFVVVPYTALGKTLGLSGFGDEPVLVFEIEDFEPLGFNTRRVFLSLKKQVLSDEEFKKRIRRVKRYIERGDVYQVNLANRFDFYLEGDARSLFLRFLRAQPVEFGFLASVGEFFIVSGSMELFLEKRGELVRSKPIKGTARSAGELIGSEKERAENLMITDMMRNDLGRVARVGSVKVEKLFKVERFRTLYHLVSEVSALTGAQIGRILGETFPPASVTGAPKRRAVEVIRELEPFSRGYYCGCAGLVFPNGDFKLSVLIRTAVGSGEEVSYFAGCGIVWDSDEEREVREMHLKTRAFLMVSSSEGCYTS